MGITNKKKDVEDVRLALQKLEQEKNSRDHAIKGLNDEIAEQDEMINRLNKEKRMVSEHGAKSSEELQSANDKVSHLLNIRKKLESTLDELEGSLEKEKRDRAVTERERRKVEGEIKMLQDTVSELDRSRKELEGLISRKEKDISVLSSKLGDEQGVVLKQQKGIKEYQGRVEELEEELEAERQGRANAERQRSDMARELEDLGERLNEAGGATAAQIELNKKREAEVQKLRKDLEEANIQHDSVLASLKKRHQDAVQEMNEQIEQLQKMKSKIEKDKEHIQSEIAADNAVLLRCVGELDNTLAMLTKARNDIGGQLNEAKMIADNEARERQLLLGKYRNIEHEVDGAKENLDEEASSLSNLVRSLNKAEGEAQMWRQKYEIDAVAKAEELEMSKMKLQARLAETENTINNSQSKLAQIEKSKHKIQVELDDMSVHLDQAQILQHTMEKRAKQFDKVI